MKLPSHISTLLVLLLDHSWFESNFHHFSFLSWQSMILTSMRNEFFWRHTPLIAFLFWRHTPLICIIFGRGTPSKLYCTLCLLKDSMMTLFDDAFPLSFCILLFCFSSRHILFLHLTATSSNQSSSSFSLGCGGSSITVSCLSHVHQLFVCSDQHCSPTSTASTLVMLLCEFDFTSLLNTSCGPPFVVASVHCCSSLWLLCPSWSDKLPLLPFGTQEMHHTTPSMQTFHEDLLADVSHSFKRLIPWSFKVVLLDDSLTKRCLASCCHKWLPCNRLFWATLWMTSYSVTVPIQ